MNQEDGEMVVDPMMNISVSPFTLGLASVLQEMFHLYNGNVQDQLDGYVQGIKNQLSGRLGDLYEWNEEHFGETPSFGCPASSYGALRMLVGWISTGRRGPDFDLSAALKDPSIVAASKPAMEEGEPFAQLRLIGKAPIVAYLPNLPSMIVDAPIQVGKGVEVALGSLSALQAELQIVAKSLEVWIPEGSLMNDDFNPFSRVDDSDPARELHLAMATCGLELIAVGSVDASNRGQPLILFCDPSTSDKWNDLLWASVETHQEIENWGDDDDAHLITDPAAPQIMVCPGPLSRALFDYAYSVLKMDNELEDHIGAYITGAWEKLSKAAGKTIHWREELSPDEVTQSMGVGGSLGFYSCFASFLGWIASGRHPSGFDFATAQNDPAIQAAIDPSSSQFPQIFLMIKSQFVAYVPDLPEMSTKIPFESLGDFAVTFGSMPGLIDELTIVGEALEMPLEEEISGTSQVFDFVASVLSAATEVEAQQAMLKGCYRQLATGVVIAHESAFPLVTYLGH